MRVEDVLHPKFLLETTMQLFFLSRTTLSVVVDRNLSE